MKSFPYLVGSVTWHSHLLNTGRNTKNIVLFSCCVELRFTELNDIRTSPRRVISRSVIADTLWSGLRHMVEVELQSL